MTQKQNILYLDKKSISDKLIEINEKPYRCQQIWAWLYRFGVDDFNLMTNLSKELRQKLIDNFLIAKPLATNIVKSNDGTIKFLLRFFDGREVEAVYIPEKTRGTLCISSQVGCTLSCKFCHTGTQTLVRNLEYGEIVAQIIVAKDIINDWQQKKLTNIVFMGMGEPFFNYDNVCKAVEIISDESGLAFSKNKITISTSGLTPEIEKSATQIGTNLAISLHATNDELRTEIMAINKKYPIKDLLKACANYNKQNPNRTLTFEYVMLNNVNDSEIHAHELVKLIKKFNLKVKINLIPFNKWQGCEFDASFDQNIINFQKIITENKIIATIRKTRGQDQMAACGQLKSQSQRVAKNKK